MAAVEPKNQSITPQRYVFNEANFPGMIITYTESGIPVVDSSPIFNVKSARAVYATVISPHGLFYSSESLSESTLLFSIPRGNQVEVVDYSSSATVAKIKYAGYTGYIRTNNLAF